MESFARALLQYTTDVYEPFLQTFIFDPLRPAITQLGAIIERIPSTPLPQGKAVQNEATWYLTPEEMAERWVTIVLVSIVTIFAMWATGAFATIRRGMFESRSQNRHPKFAFLCFATLVGIVYLKHLRSRKEVFWMCMPCHIFLFMAGCWGLYPSTLLLNVIVCFRLNSIIATVLPDFPNASAGEKVLYFTEHFALDFFPTFALVKGHEINSDSLIWATFIGLLFFGLYGIVVTVVSLIGNLNICYLLSPAACVKLLHCKSYYTHTVIAHAFFLVGSHMVGRAEGALYAFFRKQRKQE